MNKTIVAIAIIFAAAVVGFNVSSRSENINTQSNNNIDRAAAYLANGGVVR